MNINESTKNQNKAGKEKVMEYYIITRSSVFSRQSSVVGRQSSVTSDQ
jgi:hypothetical protein